MSNTYVTFPRNQIASDANGTDDLIRVKAVDNGDGTYSLQTVVNNAAAITIGGVTVADGADVALGATTGAAVTTDVNGTIQQYLRGLVKLLDAVISTKDDGPAWVSAHGVTAAPFTSADQHSGPASVTDAPTSGEKIVVTDIFFSTDTAMSVTFKCETTGAVITGPYYVPANFAGQLTPRGKAWKLATADKKLQVITSISGNIMVDAHYYSE